jgi:hypothetical protein
MLERNILPEVFGPLNRDLTYYIGADRGGWHPSKVLRVPGTLNWKRARHDEAGLTVPRGRLLWVDESRWDPDYLRAMVPNYQEHVMNERVVVSGPMPSLLGAPDRRSIMEVYRHRLPLRVISWLAQEWCTDRSMMVWRVACAMAMSEVPPEDAFQMIFGAAWNKWKDSPERLWKDIHKAYSQTLALAPKD